MFDKFAYRLESEKPFDEVVATLESRIAEHKFRVLAVHDVQKTLAEKGFEREPIKIIETCNAGFAHQALSRHMGVALFMPCRFAVYTEKGKTVVVLGRPSMIADMIPGAGLGELAIGVEETLKKAMQESV